MKLIFTFVALLLLAFPALLCEAAPIQWPSVAGGNSHYYDLVAPPAGITWTDARSAAANTTFLGITGHLVTFSSAAEYDFVTTIFHRDWTWIGLSDEAQEGNFQWVTGEPVTFTRWIPGEPNDAGGIEDYVFYQGSSGLGGAFGWNDFPDWPNVFTAALPIGYVVEFDVVPEPGTFALAALGTLSLLAVRPRREKELRAQRIKAEFS